MTVVAFDGRYLVADMQATSMGLAYAISKLRKMHDSTGNPCYVAVCGGLDESEVLFNWYRARHMNGQLVDHPFMLKESVPSVIVAFRKVGDNWQATYYYNSNEGVAMGPGSPWAWGSGREVAIGALATCGNAIAAVKAAILHTDSCGMGYEGYDLTTGQRFVIGAKIVFDDQPTTENASAEQA